jgi:hypothetical protein
MSSEEDIGIVPLVAVGGQKQKGQHTLPYDAEKTKTHRNVLTAFFVVRHVRQVLLLLFGGQSSRRNKSILCLSVSILLLKLLHDHHHRYLSMKLGWGARVVLDYSNVKNIQDLESLRKRLDSLCFVSDFVQIFSQINIRFRNNVLTNMHAFECKARHGTCL